MLFRSKDDTEGFYIAGINDVTVTHIYAIDIRKLNRLKEYEYLHFALQFYASLNLRYMVLCLTELHL